MIVEGIGISDGLPRPLFDNVRKKRSGNGKLGRWEARRDNQRGRQLWPRQLSLERGDDFTRLAKTRKNSVRHSVIEIHFINSNLPIRGKWRTALS
jgi:hypothetical protein